MGKIWPLLLAVVATSACAGTSGPQRVEARSDAPSGDAQDFALVGGRYNPCKPIHFVINEEGAPSGGADIAREAVASVSAATGIAFVDGGLTNEGASLGKRLAYQPALYAERWAPVLIGWGELTESEGLDVGGRGGSASVAGVYVTGAVTIDVDVQILSLKHVLLHELGHVMGLDDFDSPGQIMRPTSGQFESSVAWGAGDLEGLKQVGKAAGCLRDVAFSEVRQ